MTPERWARLKELFAAAIEAEAGERERLLAALRRADPELAGLLAGLLAADAGEAAAATVPWLDAKPAPTAPPVHVDRYVVLGELGRGGMSRVFLAERADGAYRQRVALKVLSGGRLASAEARQRFVAERQILARLSHPAIARLIDGGTTADGEPFLVTEYVDGRWIDVYCRENALDGEAIVRLVLDVCAAVEAAHHSLVVHRDLKPSNILVTADGEVRLLDFGIAKLLDSALDDETAVETRQGHTPLTPRYASPEQVRGEPITVATDVYSLGVVLYELLTGAWPYGETTGRTSAVVRAICEQPPRPPSAAVGLSSEAPETIRRSPGLRRWLAGDLDAVVLKALDKDPARRYGSVEQLAADLRRFLEQRPVAARRPTLAYRAARLAARHKPITAAVVAALTLLCLFLVQRQRQLEATERERHKAEAVLAMLVEVFGQADPARAQGESPTVQEALDRGVELARIRLRDQPLAEATLLDAIGTVYAGLGFYDQADATLARAFELSRGVYPRGAPELARVEAHVGGLARRRGEYAEARQHLTSALAALRAAGDRPAEVAGLLRDLALLESDQGDMERAEQLAREALALQERTLGDADLDLAATVDLLGSLAYVRGEYQSSEELLRRGLEVRRRTLGESHPATLESMNNLALALYNRNAGEESTRLLRAVVAGRQRVLGQDHPEVAVALNNLGSNLTADGRFDEAVPLLREAVRIAAALPAGNVAHAVYLANLAEAVQGQGETEEALDLFRRALAAAETVHGREHQATAFALHNLARALEQAGEVEEAEALYGEALAIYERTLPPDHVHPSFTRIQLALIALRRGDGAAAEPLLRHALAARQQAFGADHWRVTAVEVALGRALALNGRPEADATIEEAWQRLAAALGADDPHVRTAAADVADTWQRLGREESARLWRVRAEGD